MSSFEIPDSGQAPLLVKPSGYMRRNKHLCVKCDDMVQRFAYARYIYSYVLPHTGRGSTSTKWVKDLRKVPAYCLQPSFDAVSVSASNGCHICSLFLNQFRVERGGFLDIESSPETSQCLVALFFKSAPATDSALYDLVMQFKILPLQTNVQLRLQLRPIDGQKIPIVGVPDGLPFPVLETKSCVYRPSEREWEHEHQLDTICKWLEECQEKHACCRLVSEAASKLRTPPARLIYVGSAGDFSDLRLEDISPNQPLPRWVTLSHCWGPPRSISLQLMENNVEELRNQIPFKSLPKNFQDAIGTTRHLAERFGKLYLWIDALCIIQDSKSDWATESIKMGHLYSNSLCTFFACRGNDPLAGLWESPIALSRHECIVEGAPDSALHGHWQVQDVDAFANGVQKSRLFSRAWVHQEGNLASRRIYFSAGQLYWGCLQGIKAEMNPSSVLIKPWLQAETGGLSLLATQCDTDLTKQEKLDKSYGIWLEIAAHHSARNITHSTDRLPSLASIASVMLNWLEIPDDYIAGTWKSIFWACILWEIDDPRKATKAENGSPSWSWTSVEGPVDYIIRPAHFFGVNRKLEHFHPEVKFDEFHAQPAQEDFVLGSLLGASVRVRGRVLKLKMHVRVESERKIPLLAKFHYENQELPTSLTPHLDYMDDWGSTRDYDVFGLVVVRDKDYLISSVPTTERLICLVLHKAKELEPIYTRCGAFQIAKLGPDSPWGTVIEKQSSTVELKNGIECHDSYGNGIYTITLR